MNDIVASDNADLEQFKQDLIEAAKELKTIRDWFRFLLSTFKRFRLFFGHGSIDADTEANYFLCYVLALPFDEQLEPFFDAKLLNSEIKQLVHFCEQRVIKRLPGAYITKQALLQGYEFYIDQRVIIPRSFIAEIIVNGGLDSLIEYPELVHNILDLCTGNGSLAIIAADYFCDSQVIASDIDTNALEVAKINVAKHNLHDRIQLVQSDLFADLVQYQDKFDLIISNPPYISQEKMELLLPEYLYEPTVALYGGDNGLMFVEQILRQSLIYLTEFGVLVVEMGNNMEEFETIYAGLNFSWLDTISGDGFVFAVTKSALSKYFVAK